MSWLPLVPRVFPLRMPVAFFCRIIQVDVAAFHCPVICNAHESCCAVVLAGCALHFVVLFLPGSVSMCSQPSRVVLVARFQLKRVTALIVVPGFSRGRDLPQSRNFLLDVVHNAWVAYFQWPVAKSSARAAVCSCSSASRTNAAIGCGGLGLTAQQRFFREKKMRY